PGYSKANVALVWSEALRVIDEWFEQLDATGTRHNLASFDLVSNWFQATLLVIATANFGKRVSW
ncbi:hypothetical protein OG21DRAFT_1378787, partial [Imleria badia]